MKKKILSQLMILSFAFAGLFLVGNNVFADPAVLMPPDDQSGGAGIICPGTDRNWGDCMFCIRTIVYNPLYGYMYCYHCEFSGWMEDHCPYSCSEGCMSH
ncbi:MAG: hypothetical protein ACK4VN_00765 [Bacteroidales bacterium]